MKTFRLPPVLVAYIQAESARCGLDTTAFVTRVLDGYRTDYGLPSAARAMLEEDRYALALERGEYLLHALYQRQLEVRDKGPGFDAPSERIALLPIEAGR
ncbi:MAG: hypothetical protein NDI82_05250 [Anaeromyxobacteraceae bacterium]|nr:hypothetical protein [Anaeromyxobacteraceae bacterium]